MGLMITIPARQRPIASVFKQRIQRRGFDVTIAKDHVHVVSVTERKVIEIISHTAHECETVTISNRHHVSRGGHFCIANRSKRVWILAAEPAKAEIGEEISQRKNAKNIVTVKGSTREVAFPALGGRTLPHAFLIKILRWIGDAKTCLLKLCLPPASGQVGVGGGYPSGITFVFDHEVLHGHTLLMQIANALNSLSPSLGLGQNRQQKRDQNRNNGDDD